MEVKAEIKPGTEEWSAMIESVAATLKFGDIITHERISEIFGFEEPEFDTSVDLAEALGEYRREIQNLAFDRLSKVEALKESLLQEPYCFCLKNDRGTGYIVLPPKDQVEWAYKKVMRDVRSILEWGKLALTNVRASEMSKEDRAKATDNSIKISRIAQMFRDSRR